jgi:DNA-binding CsgD family transcriptional regulator
MAVPVDGVNDPLAPHSLSATELKRVLARERSGRPFLAYRDGEGALDMFILTGEGSTLTLGRRGEMDLALPWDTEVSGLHAELQSVGGEWMILDDGVSMNGTYVNGQRINGRQRLKDGDNIRIGQTVLAYNAARSAPARETVSAGAQPPPRQLTETQRRVLVALCRPYRDGAGFATPATNQQIAAELFLTTDAVKMHLRTLFARFDLAGLPQGRKRAALAERALQLGVISQRELL